MKRDGGGDDGWLALLDEIVGGRRIRARTSLSPTACDARVDEWRRAKGGFSIVRLGGWRWLVRSGRGKLGILYRLEPDGAGTRVSGRSPPQLPVALFAAFAAQVLARFLLVDTLGGPAAPAALLGAAACLLFLFYRRSWADAELAQLSARLELRPVDWTVVVDSPAGLGRAVPVLAFSLWLAALAVIYPLALPGPDGPAPPSAPPPLAVTEPLPVPTLVAVRARANLVGFISDADYPDDAIRREEQGTTRFQLDVLPEGRVGACRITASSGSPSLDRATCRVMTERARFSPARDRLGDPTDDRVSSAIRWVLPER